MAEGKHVRAVLILCLCVTSEAGSLGSGAGNRMEHAYDISTATGLRELYNARVTRAELWERPLAGVQPTESRDALEHKHSGVVVTTEDGERWLVHKGDGYGHASQTVVVSARHMSNRWTLMDARTVSNSRVADYVSAGGASYNVLLDNSHHASGRMMALT